MSKTDTYIRYNSLVTIGISVNKSESSAETKYLMRIENLDQALGFHFSSKPLIGNFELEESFFYIRDLGECLSDYSERKSDQQQNNIAKELRFVVNSKIKYNKKFILQHMMSKKFVAIEKNTDQNNFQDTYNLKLVNDVSIAAPFIFKKINEAKTSDYVNFLHKFYLKLYMQKEDQFYYVSSSDKILLDEGEQNFFEVNLSLQKPDDIIYMENKIFNIKDSSSLYAGQMINLIYTIDFDKQNKYMLGVEEKINQDTKKKEYRIVHTKYTNDLYEHLLKNTLWSIEGKMIDVNERQPLKINEYVRLKNPFTGLYLNVKKGSGILNSYEFELTDEIALSKSCFVECNFRIFNYSCSEEEANMVKDGKYILSTFIQDSEDFFKNFNINEIKKYYLPLKLYKQGGNSILVKNEDDFLFSIQKCDLYQGRQVIYIKTIINKLDKFLDNNKFVTVVVKKMGSALSFFYEYLNNIEYSFKDENYDINNPIKERQILLDKFGLYTLLLN